MPDVNVKPEITIPNITLAELVQVVGYLARAVADATVGPVSSTTPSPDYATAMADLLKAVGVLGLNLGQLKAIVDHPVTPSTVVS